MNKGDQFMTIDEELAALAIECDDRFDRQQATLIAGLRAHGVTDRELPSELARAHAEYWQTRQSLLVRLRAALIACDPH